ncbi:heat-inducible transcriptional repressor HrcA [Carbonactinospora thermoautotrophica]|uniref:Heat-inducible transcription repressor HrcA n=1 Tax=Carbonactinospora thermoautotrophica TaxID=1469144 RepID=A0A132MQE9_9ACTN|nr:heat-inducible transcriptional repressor HrcA [Carbonactinospora thermoautotrophica]KWX00098.1 HrcA family transcriptional regulator [Carbonactinospora thermoautotrophica]KWX01950.1 Heat-inducible transcription repressor hrcA [Carbonactinospora thermoautotrophica]KWX09661.1 HrcA family transcriptional regulator [Carbonactinospora thermoautotrophica]MCX9189888.1 heat-inducible transcriptional repressor HrcA [Carbonactinospora thermoautotrophica]
MLDERKLEVLRAIVEDYVATQEPVGSKALADRHNLGVSPATIRNDMAVLEEEGYITQPHTSAGRVPTDKGYRLFVDRLTTVKPLSAAERRAIQTFLDGAVDLDDVVNRTVRLLAQLTQQVAIVQYPSLTRSTVRHIELLHLPANRILMVVITNTGRVEQRTVEVTDQVDDDLLANLRSRLNSTLVGKRLTEAPQLIAKVPEQFPPEERGAIAGVLSTLLDALVEHQDERFALGGTANLARFGQDFKHSIRPVLEALEEQVVLLKLLGEATDTTQLTVRIGHENPYENLSSTSLVAVGYGPKDEVIAKLGVVGPTRMDYPGTMGAVRAVARYVGKIVAGA